MSNVEIRRARPDEFPAALELVGSLLRELGDEGDEAGALPAERLAVEHEAQGDRHVVLVAAERAGGSRGETLVGVLTLATSFALYTGGEHGVINEMYVVPGRRSSRVGAALIAAAAEHGRARGWRRIDVTAPESERWARSRAFYERQGFVFTGPKLKLLLA